MKLVYQLTSRGFYSEINNLLSAYLYALVNKLEFRLYSREWNAAFDHGWTDYFLPFCTEEIAQKYACKTIIPQSHFSHWRPKQCEYAFLLLAKKTLRVSLESKDVFHAMRRRSFINRKFEIPAYKISGDIFQAKKRLLAALFRYNSSTQNRLDQVLRSMKIAEPYVALHIRRGDKVTGGRKEAHTMGVEKYIEMARRTHRGQKTFFVATDDFSVIEQMRESYDGLTIHTLCPSNATGYSQNVFNQAPSETRKKEVLRFLAETELMIRAQLFVGTFSSNVGRVMALFRDMPTVSLDAEWSPN